LNLQLDTVTRSNQVDALDYPDKGVLDYSRVENR